MLRFIKYGFCVLAVLLAFAVTSPGDVGNFNDYDSGSSWSSDYSSSGSSSWDSSSGAAAVRRAGSSSEESDGDVSPLFILLVIAIFVVGYMMKSKGNAPRPVQRAQVKWPDIPDNTSAITRALQEADPAFNPTAFLEWAKEVFLNLQEAWMARDWEKVRPFESPELYAQHERQLQEYKRLGRINLMERINVNNAYFFSLVKDKEWETLAVVMHVRMVDYIIDEHTRQVLKGTPDQDSFASYFYVFKRKAGVQTAAAKQGTHTIACPNCGAPTHVVSSGKCEYCNFVITVKDHGWVLADIIGIKPPYNYGTGGVMIKDKPEE